MNGKEAINATAQSIVKGGQAGKQVAVKYADRSVAERAARGALAGGKEGAKIGGALLLRTLLSMFFRR